MPDRIRGIWTKFWDLVDGDSVRPFIWLYYIPLLAFGVAAIVVVAMLHIMSIPSAPLAALWIWVQVPATCSAMAGLALRHGGTPVDEMTTLLLFRDWLGLFMQFGGHACMGVVLLAFELVAYDVAGQAMAAVPGLLGVLLWWIILFAMAAISSYVIGCTLLSLQVARKILRGIELRRVIAR